MIFFVQLNNSPVLQIILISAILVVFFEPQLINTLVNGFFENHRRGFVNGTFFKIK